MRHILASVRSCASLQNSAIRRINLVQNNADLLHASPSIRRFHCSLALLTSFDTPLSNITTTSRRPTNNDRIVNLTITSGNRTVTGFKEVCFRAISTSSVNPASVMFEATSHQFCQSVGRDTLQPVSSLDLCDNIQLLQVVVKTVKRHYIFWKKAKYHPTEYQLCQLLTDQSTLDVPTETKLFLNYNRTTKFSLDGKFGAKFIDELLDINLEAADSVSVKASFGDVNKSEVDIPKLQTVLAQRKLNFHHDFVQQIRQNKNKILCVVKSVAKVVNQASLTRSINIQGKAEVEEKLFQSADAETSFEYDRGRDLVLPKETPIAYSVSELLVSTSDGSMELILGQGLQGGFQKSVGFDSPDTSTTVSMSDQNRELLFSNNREQLEQVKCVLKPILCLAEEQRQKLTASLLHLMPSLDDISILCTLVDNAEQNVDYEEPVAVLERKLVTRKDVWMQLLHMAGFSVNEVGKFSVSATKMADLESMSCVLDVLEELEAEELNLIRNCDPKSSAALLHVLEQALLGKAALPESRDRHSLLTDNAAKKLLLHLGFSVKNNIITCPQNLIPTLDEVYWVVYALWGK